MQVYKDLRVLSARPTVEEEKTVPHRLYGMVGAEEDWSVAKWLDAALGEIEVCWQEGRLPILTGGTGLYFKALEHGLADIPDIPQAIREAADHVLETSGIEALYADLAQYDPVAYARLHANDSQRIRRAWEVVRATGKGLDYWYSKGQRGLLARSDITFGRHAILPDRDWLYQRCDQRVHMMIEQGALHEVEALKAKPLASDSGIMKALGVGELAAYLEGELLLDGAVSLLQRNTRRYAKRQLTWFRNQAKHWEMQSEQLNVKNIIESFS
jgi:tRNA dimethylallyltransferase